MIGTVVRASGPGGYETIDLESHSKIEKSIYNQGACLNFLKLIVTETDLLFIPCIIFPFVVIKANRTRICGLLSDC
jgi:hypothetical protein